MTDSELLREAAEALRAVKFEANAAIHYENMLPQQAVPSMRQQKNPLNREAGGLS